MNHLLNHKYNTHSRKLNQIRDAIHSENCLKFRYGHQWKIEYTKHFSERVIDRDVPLQFVMNVTRYLMEYHRFEFRKYGKHLFIMNKIPFVISTNYLPGQITEIHFLSVLEEGHSTDNIDYPRIKVSLAQLMELK